MKNAQEKQEISVQKLINKLISIGYIFISPTKSEKKIQEHIKLFDKGRTGLINSILHQINGGEQIPESAKWLIEETIHVDAEDFREEDINDILKNMCSNFQLYALAFNKLSGPRFLAIFNGDFIEKSDFFHNNYSFSKNKYVTNVSKWAFIHENFRKINYEI